MFFFFPPLSEQKPNLLSDSETRVQNMTSAVLGCCCCCVCTQGLPVCQPTLLALPHTELASDSDRYRDDDSPLLACGVCKECRGGSSHIKNV